MSKMVKHVDEIDYKTFYWHLGKEKQRSLNEVYDFLENNKTRRWSAASVPKKFNDSDL